MTLLKIDHLQAGGIITNYYCTSACKHCLYRCSAHWPKHYMDEATARKALECCISMGCSSVHIGGGEPFLNIKSLKNILKIARNMGIHIEYVETNASWCIDQERTLSILCDLQDCGLETVLISISPFHLEYIPLKRVHTLIHACQQCKMAIFLWRGDFLNDFAKLDPSRCYSMEEIKSIFGPHYIESIPSKYWIHPGGRALDIFFKDGQSLEDILDSSKTGCLELADTSHFHIDLYLNYIPGLCAGLAIHAADIADHIDPNNYPIVSTLFEKGIPGLYNLALSMGFKPTRDEYGSKCTLCYEIRRFLIQKKYPAKDLAPKHHYLE